MRKFTKQQVDFICYQIGEWYVQWKNQLVDYDNKQHMLGYAKEVLKERICGEEYYELEDEYAPNLNIYKKPREKPWETEPDLLEFIDEDTGYRCFIQRHPELKHLCGYVELPKEHKLYGKTNVDNEFFLNLDVHGGVTYANAKRIKRHEKRPNLFIDEYASFVVGFDCGHAGDLVPYLYNCNPLIGGSYKDIEYVTNECKNLAKQLKELEN